MEEDKDSTSEQMVDQGGLDSSEEAFMKGYAEEDEVIECAECGSGIEDDKKIVEVVDEETLTFCSQSCADDYKESIRN